LDEAKRREAGVVGQRLGLLVAEALVGEAAKAKGEAGDGRGGEGELPLTAAAKEGPDQDNHEDKEARERASDERAGGCAVGCLADNISQRSGLGCVVRH
jgi:hypothetical protein